MKKKLIVLSVGLITTLLFLEIALRLMALYSGATGVQEQSLAVSDKKKERIILALGNSFTLGVGASPEFSYPAQLERLLNQEYGEGTWRVINRGQGNINTYGERLRFHEELSKYKPDLILFLGGQPNWWNNFGFESFLNGEESFKSSFLENFKTYKLLEQWLAFKKKKVIDCQIDGEAQVQEEILAMDFWQRLNKDKTLITELKEKWVPYWEKGLLSSKESQNKDVFFALLGQAYFFYLNDQRKGLDLWMKSIEEDECGTSLTWANSYVLLRSIERTLSPELQKVLEDFKSRLNEKKKMTLNYETSLVSRWALHDLSLLAHEAKQKQVPIIFINYPPLKKQYYGKEINQVLREFSQKEKIPLIDIESYFMALLSQGRKTSDLYNVEQSESHPNAQGYGLMAKFILKSLRENDLLEKTKKKAQEK